MIKVVEKSTSVKYYVNKRNRNKYLEVHADGYGHYKVVQFMRWSNGVENKTGDKILHRWRVDNLSELLADYEECPNPRTDPRFDKNSEFMDYSINDGKGYIMSYSDYVNEFNSDPDLQYDFGNVDAYINAMLDNGDIRIFYDIYESYGSFDSPNANKLANWSNRYKVTFNDGTVKYTRAKCKLDAEQNVCWIDDVDRSDDIVSVEELTESTTGESRIYSFLDKRPEVIKLVRTSSNKFDVYENADHTTFIYHVEELPDKRYYIWNDEDGYDNGEYYDFDDFAYTYTGYYDFDNSEDCPIEELDESIKYEATDPKIRKQMSRDIWDLLWKYNNETNDDFYKDLKELGKKYADYKSTFYSIRKRILDKEMWYD